MSSGMVVMPRMLIPLLLSSSTRRTSNERQHMPDKPSRITRPSRLSGLPLPSLTLAPSPFHVFLTTNPYTLLHLAHSLSSMCLAASSTSSPTLLRALCPSIYAAVQILATISLSAPGSGPGQPAPVSDTSACMKERRSGEMHLGLLSWDLHSCIRVTATARAPARA